MLKIQTRDGKTLALDLGDEAEAKRLLSSGRELTALIDVSQHAGGPFQHTVVRPQGFRSVRWNAERVEVEGKGERIIVIADDVRLTLMVHERHAASRISLARLRQVYSPE